MIKFRIPIRAAAAPAAVCVIAQAGAQAAPSYGAQFSNFAAVPGVPFHAAGFSVASVDRDAWRTIMLISGIVLIVGLVDNDSTLAILGGAGLLVSFVESGPPSFAYRGFRGFPLMQSGPFTFGISPYGQLGLARGLDKPCPSPFATVTFKF